MEDLTFAIFVIIPALLIAVPLLVAQRRQRRNGARERTRIRSPQTTEPEARPADSAS